MKMKPKALSLRLLVLFLVFSFVLSSTLKTTTDKTWIQESEKQGKLWGFFEENELHIEGRMDTETADYSGAEANRNHDPRPPGNS